MSKVVVIPFAVLALSVAMVGCDGGDTNTTVTPPEVTVNTPEVTTTINNPPVTTLAPLTATIAGRVVDSASGFPVAGATVSVNAPGVVATTTTSALAGQEGSFSIQNIPRTETNSPVILTVTGAALVGRSYPFSTNAVVSLASAAAAGAVQSNVVLAGVEIELHAQTGRITGLIVGPNGLGLPGVEISLSPVQIPVITPGVGTTGPTTGVLPFTLTTQTVTTSSAPGNVGAFSLDNVPEDWVYDISVIPGGGAQIVTFTNQYLPSGSLLNFPDVFGPPQDSGFAQSLVLAGTAPLPLANVVGTPVPRLAAFAPTCTGGCPVLGGGPVVVVPAVLPGDSPDQIAPYIVDNSPLVDGTIISAAQNTPGQGLRITFSEPILNTAGQLVNSLRLRQVNFRGTAPVCNGPLAPGVNGTSSLFCEGLLPNAIGAVSIPFDVSLNATNTEATLIPRVLDNAGNAIALPPGSYSVTGLSTIQDVGGNFYTGFTSSLNTRVVGGDVDNAPLGNFPGPEDVDINGDGVFTPTNGLDAAGAVEFARAGRFAVPDFELDFAVLGDTTLPSAPSVTTIQCSASSCNNGTTAFNVVFGAGAGAVQYFGAFATEGDITFSTDDATLASAGPLFDPPELVPFSLGTVAGLQGVFDNGVVPDDYSGMAGDMQALRGFNYPLVLGTETSGTLIFNNFFDDGIQYQVGIQAENLQGIRGPLQTTLIGDNTRPAFLTNDPTAANTIGSGNDINQYIPNLPAAMFSTDMTAFPGTINLGNAYYVLENFFSTAMTEAVPAAESIPIFEGPTGMAGGALAGMGTVGFNFITQVAGVAREPFLATPPPPVNDDFFYSAPDLLGLGTIASMGLNIRLNEQILAPPAANAPTLVPPVLSSPDLSGFAFSNGAFMSFADIAAALNQGNIVTSTITMNPNPIDGTVNLAYVSDMDSIMDDDTIEVVLSDIWAADTGDALAFEATGIQDEAGNAIAANTTLVLANHIPAAISSAITRVNPADGSEDQLILTFTRPIFIPRATVDGSNRVLTDLGLSDPNPNNARPIPGNLQDVNAGQGQATSTSLANLSADGLMLTITKAVPAPDAIQNALATNNVQGDSGLASLTDTTYLSGNGLQTLDALNFILGPLNVNVFAGGTANILVDDTIPPRIINVIDATGATVNQALGEMNGIINVGDTQPDFFIIGVVLSKPILRGNEDGSATGMFSTMDAAAAGLSLTVGNGPNGTATFGTSTFDGITPATAALLDDHTVFFTVPFNRPNALLNPVVFGTTITINGVMDLSGNSLSLPQVSLCAVGNGVNLPNFPTPTTACQ